jgi:hypothetical protein
MLHLSSSFIIFLENHPSHPSKNSNFLLLRENPFTWTVLAQATGEDFFCKLPSWTEAFLDDFSQWGGVLGWLRAQARQRVIVLLDCTSFLLLCMIAFYFAWGTPPVFARGNLGKFYRFYNRVCESSSQYTNSRWLIPRKLPPQMLFL